MSNPRIIQGLVLRSPGTMYNLPKKMEVAEIYIDLYFNDYPVSRLANA
jgi:hypothetical protein